MDRHSIFWLFIPFTFPLLVVAGWLIAKATVAFAKSRVAWIARPSCCLTLRRS